MTNLKKILDKIFFLRDIDSHYVLTFFNSIQISIRHQCSFKYKPAEMYGLTKIKRSPELIVSLTSYPKRINVVHRVINTILRQKLKPDRLIIWLAAEQFPRGKHDLPKNLLDLEKFGLEIRWCEDLKSYKKLVPALKEFPEDIIVTADDDIYYDEDWLESLYNAYLKNTNNIYVRRAIKLSIKDNNLIPLSSRLCRKINMRDPDYMNQMLGGSGCLYPPGSLYKDVICPEKFINILPYNDDVFFWAMAVMNKTKIDVIAPDKTLHFVDEVQSCGLCHINREIGDNNTYESILKCYPEIIEILGNNA